MWKRRHGLGPYLSGLNKATARSLSPDSLKKRVFRWNGQKSLNGRVTLGFHGSRKRVRNAFYSFPLPFRPVKRVQFTRKWVAIKESKSLARLDRRGNQLLDIWFEPVLLYRERDIVPLPLLVLKLACLHIPQWCWN